MSEEVVSALEFDPFTAMDQRPTESRPPEQRRDAPSVPFDRPEGTGDRAPGRDPTTGRYTPAGQPAQQGRQVPAAPTVGRDVSPDGTAPQPREAPRVPTGGAVRPDEGPQVNS